MIRKTKKHMLKPVYRELIPSALREAWRERWLWPFAIFAALLHTGGVYDVILRSMRMVQNEGAALVRGNISPAAAYGWQNLTLGNGWLSFLGTVQSLAYAIIFVFALLALSVIAQGALVFGIGTRIRGKKPTFRECLGAGAHVFGKIAALNVITIGAIWLSRLILLLPYGYAATRSSFVSVSLYLLTALAFIGLIIALTSIHFFALNAILLQDAHLAEAIERGFLLLRKGWLAVLELALLLFGVGIIVFIIGIVTLFIMAIPLVLLMLGALLVGFHAALSLGYFVGTFLVLLLVLAAGAFTVTFQYAAWHRLFIQLGEGGAVAKLHRWSHWFMGMPKRSKK